MVGMIEIVLLFRNRFHFHVQLLEFLCKADTIFIRKRKREQLVYTVAIAKHKGEIQ